MAKFLEVDNHELNEFTQKFEQLTNNDLAIRLSIESVARAYLGDLKAKTPVKTGRLRNQWDLDNIGVRAEPIGNGYMITLINTTEYASWVEKGHNIYNQFGGPYGWCMGRFFVRKTENIWNNGKLDTNLEREITRWINVTLN